MVFCRILRHRVVFCGISRYSAVLFGLAGNYVVVCGIVWRCVVMRGIAKYSAVLCGVVKCCAVLPGVVWHRNCIAVAVADMIMGFLARERDQLTMCQFKGSVLGSVPVFGVLGVPVFGVLGSVLGLPDARKY